MLVLKMCTIISGFLFLFGNSLDGIFIHRLLHSPILFPIAVASATGLTDVFFLLASGSFFVPCFVP